ncbi:MAG: beta-lactamase family protein [Candidatus Eremiobacteraeota bacterium]|nr:beta-lactamase family protein [Candidatus Eremiobacteraeota bacterium]
MRHLQNGLLLAVFTFCLAALPAGTPRPPLTNEQIASIDRFVAAEMSRTHVPGAAVGIYSRGEVLLAKGYGLANVELNVPVKPETIFQSGSVGKQFVSAAIMMLVEEGRVSLNDSISKYFPHAPPSWKPILVKNLLSHTSGLAEYESDERTGPNGPFYLRLDFTERQLLRKIEALPIESPPGVKWDYRNTNYVLLGMLIHKVTGTFYADYLAERIFKPLGMSSTRPISETDIIPNRAAGYQWDGTLKNQDWVSPTFNSTADGTLYFNVPDLAKWDEALYTTRLLRQSSLDTMWTVYKLRDGKPNPANYGFGWIVATQNGHRLIEHDGAWQGFTCSIQRYPNDSLTVVVLTNLDAANARPEYMATVIAGLADEPLLPQKLTDIPDTQPQIAKSLATLLDTLRAGANARALVAPDVADYLKGESPTIERTISALWPGGSLTLVSRRPSLENRALTTSRFRLTKGALSELIWFRLDARGKVDELFFEPDEEYQEPAA